jgi:hypothetical protein
MDLPVAVDMGAVAVAVAIVVAVEATADGERRCQVSGA